MDMEVTVLFLRVTMIALAVNWEISTAPEVFEQHVHADLVGSALPRKALLVTFEDAYKSVLNVGGLILRAVPALFFINPATVMTASTLVFWTSIARSCMLGLARDICSTCKRA